MPFKPGTVLHGIRTVDDLRLRCDIDDDTGCWQLKSRKPSKYGPAIHIVIGAERRSVKCRHAALSLVAGKFIKHRRSMPKARCMTDHCCNPDHSMAMTHAQYGKINRGKHKGSMAFSIASQITAQKRGIAKLTREIVTAIRSSSATNKELAERYGVSTNAIYAARAGRTWKQVPANSVFNLPRDALG